MPAARSTAAYSRNFSGGSVRNCRAFTMKKFYAGSRRKGCEGCAADDGDGCKLQKGDAKVAGNVYQPVWEQQGLTPDTMVW